MLIRLQLGVQSDVMDALPNPAKNGFKACLLVVVVEDIGRILAGHKVVAHNVGGLGPAVDCSILGS